MEFTLPVGDQVRLGDLPDRELVRPAITFNLHETRLGPAQRAGEIAPPLHLVRETNTGALPRKSRKISFPPKGPIKPWRAHFQLIGVTYQIRDVERRRDIPAHPRTVVVRNHGLSLL